MLRSVKSLATMTRACHAVQYDKEQPGNWKHDLPEGATMEQIEEQASKTIYKLPALPARDFTKAVQKDRPVLQ